MGKNEASKQELEDARAAFAQREAELTQELRCTLHACEEAQAHAADLAGERDVAAARADQSKAELQEVREGAQQQQTALQMALREAEGQRDVLAAQNGALAEQAAVLQAERGDINAAVTGMVMRTEQLEAALTEAQQQVLAASCI